MKRHKSVTAIAVAAVLMLVVTATALAAGGNGLGRRFHIGSSVQFGLAAGSGGTATQQELRTEHMREMQTWLATYGSDSGSPAAQLALRDLQLQHRAEMGEAMGVHGRAMMNPVGSMAGFGGAMMNPGVPPASPGGSFVPGSTGGMMGGE